MTNRGLWSKRRNPPRREILILAAIVLLAAMALMARLAFKEGQDIVPKPVPAAVTVTPGPVEPAFDVIRVTREGRAVMAGRATPGAKIVVKSGDQVLGEVIAGKRGDWVMIPDQPLKPGAQVLTLTAQAEENSPLLSRDSAVISVPERPDGEVFVAISRPGQATRILDQGLPGTATPGVSVAGVDLPATGGAMLSGRAEPGSRVLVYLDNQPVGKAVADPGGDWELAYAGSVASGKHLLRADQLDAENKVTLRSEVAFSRAAEGQLVLGAQQVVVVQGNALWEIARNIYGSGIAYSMIFTSNKQQIRNPDLIYPGQVFDIPAPTPDTAGRPDHSNTIP